MKYQREVVWRERSTQRRRSTGRAHRQLGMAVAILVAVTVASWTVVAFAQEPAQTPAAREEAKPQEAEPLVIEEITVSATKTRRDPTETPGEVNIITREEIDRVQAQSLEDVLRYQPGVDVRRGPRRIGELPVIRGLSGPRVLTTVDGVRLNFQSGHKGQIFLDMDSVKRIEIVRGPGSALWGSGALGGVVAFTTRDPADYLEPDTFIGGALKLGFQEVNDEFRWSPTLFGRIGPHVEYLASLTGRHSGDIRLGGDAGTLRESGEDLLSGLGKLVWRPTLHDDLKFSIQGFGEDGRVPSNPASDTTEPASLRDRQTTQLTYRLGYTHRNPANPYFNPEGFIYLTTMDLEELRITDQRRDDVDFNTFGFDLRNSSRFGAAAVHQHVLTYGVEWYRDSQEGTRAGAPNRSFPDADQTTLALYIQDEIALWDRWIIIAGLRWDRWENDAEGQEGKSDSRLNPKIGSVFRVSDSLYLEASYGEGFRAPTFGELFISGTHFPGAVFVPNPDLEPEKSRNIDVGIRIKRDRLLFAQDRFLLRGAYFRNSLDDFIDFETTFVPPAGPLEFKQVNVQEALIEGFEAEMAWGFYPGFTLSANYTQTRGTNETDDEPLASIPPRKGVVGLSYFHAPWGLTVGGRVQIVDDQDRVPEGVEETPGYTVYDVFANWQPRAGPLKGVRVDFGIDNLTDKEYRRHLAGIPEAGINPKVAVSYTRSW